MVGVVMNDENREEIEELSDLLKQCSDQMIIGEDSTYQISKLLIGRGYHLSKQKFVPLDSAEIVNTLHLVKHNNDSCTIADYADAIYSKFGTKQKSKSDLEKDKYFTYMGVIAHGKFYIEFENGWPKEMLILDTKPSPEIDKNKLCQALLSVREAKWFMKDNGGVEKTAEEIIRRLSDKTPSA